jgi:hypothetical protein
MLPDKTPHDFVNVGFANSVLNANLLKRQPALFVQFTDVFNIRFRNLCSMVFRPSVATADSNLLASCISIIDVVAIRPAVYMARIYAIAIVTVMARDLSDLKRASINHKRNARCVGYSALKKDQAAALTLSASPRPTFIRALLLHFGPKTFSQRPVLVKAIAFFRMGADSLHAKSYCGSLLKA